MPVLVACRCGKRLKVPDEYAGRNVRCPVCKAVMLATPSAAHTPSPAPASTISQGNMVRFQCSGCGKEMQALVQYGGQETICPSCSTPAVIPGRAEKAVQLAPSKSSSAPAETTDAELPSSPRLRAKKPRRMGLWLALGACLLILGGGVFAAWYYLRDSLPADLTLVPPDAEAFVTLRGGEVWKSPAGIAYRNALSESQHKQIQTLESDLGFTLDNCERFTAVSMDFAKDVVWCVISTKEPYDRKRVLDTLVPGAVEATHQGRQYHIADKPDAKLAVYCHTDRVLVVGPKAGIMACLDHLAARKTEGPLKAAIKEAAGKRQFVAGFNPKSSLADVLRKELPPALKKFEPLLDAQRVVLKGDISAEKLTLQLDAALSFADNNAAEAARNLAEGLKNAAIEQLGQLKKARRFKTLPEPQRELAGQMEVGLKNMNVALQKETVVVQFPLELTPPLVAALLRSSGAEAAGAPIMHFAGATSISNLHEIGKALLSYHEHNGKFPRAASVDAQNKPLLSWRVHLLPDLGETELYRRFHLNEPWDSPHNIELLAEMPAVYHMPNYAAPAGKTFYKVFVGPKATFDGPKQPTRADIVDGLDKTIAVVEHSTPVEWTKPEDIPFAPEKGPVKPETLGLPGSGAFSVVFFSGGVATYQHGKIMPRRLKSLITPSGHD